MSAELETFLESRNKTDLLEEIRRISHLADVSYVRQGEPLGLGHAVLVTRELVGDEPFAVVLADDVIDAEPAGLKQMVDVFERVQGPVLAVERVPWDRVSSYGIVDIESESGGRLQGARSGGEAEARGRAVEPRHHRPLHPDAGHLRGARGHVARPDRRDPAHQRHPPPPEEAPGLRLRIKGVRHDAGNKLGYLKATVYFALKREDLAEEFGEYLRALKL